jgi:Ca2+-transporting ATPase
MDLRYLDKEGHIQSSKKLIADFGDLDALAARLGTDLKTGLKESKPDQIALRQAIFGKNSFEPPKMKGICELIMENFEDFINRVLLAAALVSVVIGEIQHPMTWKGLLEGTSIAIALTIIIVVTSTNNYLAERRLAALVALSDK